MQDKYYNISRSQLSVARMFGGCKINGKMYIYNPKDDSLTLESLMQKKSIEEKKAIKKRFDDMQIDMFKPDKSQF